jgi:hypothetical protein
MDTSCFVENHYDSYKKLSKCLNFSLTTYLFSCLIWTYFDIKCDFLPLNRLLYSAHTHYAGFCIRFWLYIQCTEYTGVLDSALIIRIYIQCTRELTVFPIAIINTTNIHFSIDQLCLMHTLHILIKEWTHNPWLLVAIHTHYTF